MIEINILLFLINYLDCLIRLNLKFLSIRDNSSIHFFFLKSIRFSSDSKVIFGIFIFYLIEKITRVFINKKISKWKESLFSLIKIFLEIISLVKINKAKGREIFLSKIFVCFTLCYFLSLVIFNIKNIMEMKETKFDNLEINIPFIAIYKLIFKQSIVNIIMISWSANYIKFNLNRIMRNLLKTEKK